VRYLSSRAAATLTAVLLVQGGVFYATAMRPERTPDARPLEYFPAAIGPWRTTADLPIEREILDVLRADDTLNRVYASPSLGTTANLFIAYFKTQRAGATPHSPKNCLPGSGWEPVETPATVSIDVPGRSSPIVVNRYVVARGDQESVVLYWYQSHDRIIASEFSAKFWLISDAIRYRRSDTALVKVVVPVRGETELAVRSAVEFVKAAFPALQKQLPS
jgi:EpsI family protein